MPCAYCSGSLPHKAVYCPTCGRKQDNAPTPRRRLRRSQGQGTITKLPGRRNPYWVRLPAEYDGTAVTRKSLGCFPTRAEAAKALGEAMYAPKPPNEPTVPTLQDMYERFIASHYYAALSSSAQGSHRSAWKHLSPSCATTPINEANKETFQSPIDIMAQKGLKRETLAKARNLSSLLCKEAMGLGRGWMTTNFGRLVQLPQNDAKDIPPFSTKQLKQLWACADNGDMNAKTILVLCYTGMRPGELLSARIEEHLHTDDPHWYFCNGSKTEAGMGAEGIGRIIPIPPLIRPLILQLIGDRTEGPVVASPKGRHWRLDNWRPRCFNTLMESLNIQNHVPYSCRHTYSDLQKRRKVSPEIMMTIMGHEDYAVTVEHYQTTTEEDIARICEAAEGLTRPE